MEGRGHAPSLIIPPFIKILENRAASYQWRMAERRKNVATEIPVLVEWGGGGKALGGANGAGQVVKHFGSYSWFLKE